MPHNVLDLEILNKIRKFKPLVHNVTNLVSMETIANMLLALGAAPLMSHAPQESSDIGRISNSLVLNIGTLDENWVQAFEVAQKNAQDNGTPIILDPVGAGASAYRTETAKAILSRGVSIVRGNASEIKALLDATVVTKGVESTEESTSVEEIARKLSQKYSSVVIVSGRVDIIVKGDQTFYLEKPAHTYLPRVTGMGCGVTALVGAFAAVEKDHFKAACNAMMVFAFASQRAMTRAKGPGTFHQKLLDGLSSSLSDSPNLILFNGQGNRAVIKEAMGIPKLLSSYGSFDSGSNRRFSKSKASYAVQLVANLDTVQNDGDRLVELVKKVVTGTQHGVTCVLLRAKTADSNTIISTATKLKKLLEPYNDISFMINDHVQIAKLLDLDGAHVGQKDMPVSDARRLLGSNKIIGLSITNSDNARSADPDADYYAVGPIFPTKSKLDADPPIGCEGLREIQGIIRHKPIIVIGGINFETMDQVMECRPSGVSVISAIMAAADPAKAAEKLRNYVDNSDRLAITSLLQP
ncbi:MAG: hydroxyethylthiazole kinase [Proteobacteria bacterium]|nr:hydroxyethylthiazole kinase [Pseudomonadota bacterium]